MNGSVANGSVALKIEEAVSVGLTCLEQGLDNKATVKSNILKAFSQNSILIRKPHTLEEFPTEVFYWLHNEFGLGFEIHDGKIISAYVEEISHNLVEKGIDFGSKPDVGRYVTLTKGCEK